MALIGVVACKSDPTSEKHEHDLEIGHIQIPQYAQGFYIDHHTDYTLIVLKNLEDSTQLDRLVYLVDEGVQIDEKDGEVVRLPIKELACLSTTHLAMIDLLNGWEVLKGIAYADKVIDSTYREKIESYHVKNLSSGWNLDKEKIMAAQPELFLTYPYEDEAQSALQSDNFQTLGLMEYLEPHPLGRAEWIKVIGCALGKEKEAEEIFGEIVGRYNDVATRRTNKSNIKPITFTGSYYQGQWSVPGGKSLAAKFIGDAGGQYYFEDRYGASNIIVDYETLASISTEISWWGALGYFEEEPLAVDIAGGDERLLDFDAFKQERLFYCNTRTTDYFGRGVMEPHVMLDDLFMIYNRGFVEEYQFKYFFPLHP